MRHIFRQSNGWGFLTYVPREFLHHFVRKDMVGLHVNFSLCSVVYLQSLPDSNGTISISSIRMAHVIELCNPFLLPINCSYLARCLPYFIAHFCHTWRDTLNALLYRYGE